MGRFLLYNKKTIVKEISGVIEGENSAKMRCNRGVIEIFLSKFKELHKKKNRIVLAQKWLNNAVWRRKRDLNPRAGYPTYSLSRGAPSPLGYFSMVKYIEKYTLIYIWRRGRDSNSWSLARSLVFKTSSLNHSDTPPDYRYGNRTTKDDRLATVIIILDFLPAVNSFFEKIF